MTSLHAVINRRFDKRGRLPGQVFRDSESLGFLLTESALITAAECWSIMQTLARRFGDQAVFAEVVDDLREQDSRRPLETFESETIPSDDAFARWLREPQRTRTEPLYVDARIIAVTGSSGAWGLWFDQDKELAVLGVPATALGAVRDELYAEGDWPWHDASNVAELLGSAFEPQPVPEALVRQIRRSYAPARVDR